MSEELWTELEVLGATLDRLQRDLARCAGASTYKAGLEADIREILKRKEEVSAELGRGLP